jgi:hypothetical protein
VVCLNADISKPCVDIWAETAFFTLVATGEH